MLHKRSFNGMKSFGIFKINPGKFKELTKVCDLDYKTNHITLFTEIETLPLHVGAVYIEKSDFEIAFEAFLREN